MAAPKPILRGDQFYIRRRVPLRYRPVESREFVWLCLHTDSREIADRKAPEVWAQMIEAWEAKLAGDSGDAQARFEAARNLAAARGYRYLDAAQVAQLPIDEIVRRVEAAIDAKGHVDEMEAEALLGGAVRPVVSVSRAFDLFYEVERARILGKSDDQIRRHRAPRLKATRNFIAAKGDMGLHEITSRDLHDFKAKWLERVADGEVTKNTANKDFSYLLAMWRAVAAAREIPLQFSTDRLLFEEKEKDRTRPPFSEKWLREKLIPGLGRLNGQARGIVLMMINTGARPSELAGLTAPRIVLDAEIPHILIAPEGRTLKSAYAERVVPLVGVSLEAARANCGGFPTYADNPALSDTINKFMTENGLRETPRHSLYSIRHSFESRMIRADFPERLKAELMGHRLKRERYGEVGLDHMRDWLLKIAL